MRPAYPGGSGHGILPHAGGRPVPGRPALRPLAPRARWHRTPGRPGRRPFHGIDCAPSR